MIYAKVLSIKSLLEETKSFANTHDRLEFDNKGNVTCTSCEKVQKERYEYRIR